ncbi:MAG: aminotransferase class V-fold PLP-dependent enzyme, partial [Chloroflexota bacterium]
SFSGPCGLRSIPSLDVAEIGCDILSGTGRKYLRGPRGTGLLYVRRDFIEQLEPPLLDQHAAMLHSPTEYQPRADAKRFENWECFYAGKAALGVAMDYAVQWDIETTQQRIYYLADQLRSKLSAIDGVTVTDAGQERCGIVTFMSEQQKPVAIKQALSQHKINVSTSGVPGSLIDFQERGLDEVVRASLHYFNTEGEIDFFVETLKRALT